MCEGECVYEGVCTCVSVCVRVCVHVCVCVYVCVICDVVGQWSDFTYGLILGCASPIIFRTLISA